MEEKTKRKNLIREYLLSLGYTLEGVKNYSQELILDDQIFRDRDKRHQERYRLVEKRLRFFPLKLRRWLMGY